MDIGNLPDGGVVLDADQFVVSRNGTARRVQGQRLVRTDVSGNALLSGDPIIAAGRKLRMGNRAALGGDGGDTTFLYTGDDALIVRNAADSATLFRLSSTGTGTLTGTLNLTGALTQAGNQVWHAGNFSPSSYAALSGATFTGGVIAPGIATPGGVGRVGLSGGNATNVGFIEFVRASGVRDAYIGSNPNGTAITFVTENGGGWNFQGAVTTNSTFNSAGTLSQAGNAVWHSGNLQPSNYATLSGATFTGPININGPRPISLNTAGTVTIRGDAGGWENSFSFLDASGSPLGGFGALGGGNAFNFWYIGTSSNSPSNLRLTQAGVLTVAGNQVWHAGNFLPSDYARLNGAVFTGGVTAPTYNSGGQVRLSGDANQTYLRTGPMGLNFANSDFNASLGVLTNAGNLNIVGSFSSAGAIKENGAQVWHAGNFSPSSYQPLLGYTPANRSGDTFTGTVIAPVVQLANGISVSAVGGKLAFTVGGSVVTTVDAAGNVVTKGNISSTNGGAL